MCDMLHRCSRSILRVLFPAVCHKQHIHSSKIMSFSNGQGWGSDMGSGAGKGGGSGGSIREAGGSFGKMEAAREDEYFYKLQKAQLKNLRTQVDQELEFHEQQLKHHQDAIERHKKRQRELHAEEQQLEKEK